MSLHRQIREAVNRCTQAQALWVAVISNPHATDRLIENTEENCNEAQGELRDLLDRLYLLELHQAKEEQ